MLNRDRRGRGPERNACRIAEPDSRVESRSDPFRTEPHHDSKRSGSFLSGANRATACLIVSVDTRSSTVVGTLINGNRDLLEWAEWIHVTTQRTLVDAVVAEMVKRVRGYAACRLTVLVDGEINEERTLQVASDPSRSDTDRPEPKSSDRPSGRQLLDHDTPQIQEQLPLAQEPERDVYLVIEACREQEEEDPDACTTWMILGCIVVAETGTHWSEGERDEITRAQLVIKRGKRSVESHWKNVDNQLRENNTVTAVKDQLFEQARKRGYCRATFVHVVDMDALAEELIEL
jgi:hypothetical protein